MNGVYKNYRVNRIVALTFLEKPTDKDIVHHKNHKPHDNRLSNL